MSNKKEKDDLKLYRFLRPAVVGLFKFLYHPTVVGEENIPENGRAVLAGNHTSVMDCFMLAIATKRCVHFLAKAELFKGKFLNGFFRGLGAIPVHRKRKDHNALVSALDVLKEDRLIGIFPEATLNRGEGVILPFKIGAVKMASDTKSPVVPFIISGDYKLFRKSVKIEFLAPYYIENSDLKIENEKLMQIVSDGIVKAKAERK